MQYTVTISQMKRIIKALLENDQAKSTSINLLGPPGLGKTQCMEQVAEEIGARCSVFLTATMDPTDVVGVPHPVNDITRFLPPEDLQELTDQSDYKGRLLVLFDDMPNCQDQVFAALFRLFQQREISKRKIRDNVVLCATGNRTEDNSGAKEIPTALANRFVHFNLKVDVEEWREWAVSSAIVPELVAYVKTRGIKVLHDFDPSAGFLAFPTPRSVAKASDLIKAIGYDNSSRGDLTVALAGCCGEGWATEFTSFLEIRDRIVPVSEVIKDPENARVPSERDIDVTYALITSLVYHLNNNLNANEAIQMLKYSTRFPQKDLAITLAKDILNVVNKKGDVDTRVKVTGNKIFREIMPKYSKYLI